MPLNSYANLQNSVLDWLARPGDPNVAPAVPDMIEMFEEEARDRLHTRFTEVTTTIVPPAGASVIPLPSDFVQMRELYVTTGYGNTHFHYQTPRNLDENIWASPGYLVSYTIEGLNMRVVGTTPDPANTNPDTPSTITLVYFQGLPGLSTTTTTNWLLQQYPSLYLFGTLTFASLYIGDDPRAPTWLSAREAGFQRIKEADWRAKYPEGLMMATDVRNP